jgi:microcystin degradation protein MlrC
VTVPRIGVVSIAQETNTFSPLPSTLADFESQGIFKGKQIEDAFAGTNTEIGGALGHIRSKGFEAVPVLRAWAMSSGPIVSAELKALGDLLSSGLSSAGHLDGLVLSLHGALVDQAGESGDLYLLREARRTIGPGGVIGVCFDLHANLTRAMEKEADLLVGYLTYPHVDQGSTGARAARLVVDRIAGSLSPVTRIAKVPLLIPAEAQGFEGPLGELRRLGDRRTEEGCLDVSLFPVQPWLDVDELGFGVAVTTDGDEERAARTAREIAEAAWRLREEFLVSLERPEDAIEKVRRSPRRPVVLSESADSPTSGTPADSPAMVRELLEHGRDLRACVSLVDAAAVGACSELGEGGRFTGQVGCSFEHRFHDPVEIVGTVSRLGGGSFELTGPAFTGMSVSMGRYAVVSVGRLEVLLTERPAPTFDPEAYRVAGIEVGQLDAVVVRSANLFRSGYAGIAADALILDLPGASTPRLESLTFLRAPRPLYPLDK